MGEKLKIGILYLGLHNQLVKAHGVNCLISRKDFFIKLAKHYLIPSHARHQVMKEMENLKLIEKVNRDTLKILELKINIESNQNKLYELML